MIEQPLPRILPCGDSAVSVEFGECISEQISDHVLALDRVFGDRHHPAIQELVPTYRALCIHYDPRGLRFDEVVALVHQELRALNLKNRRPTGRVWRVPVCYGGDHGIDLGMLAERAGTEPDEIVTIHSAATYRVYMIGFSAGFTYLGGLDTRLACPRRAEPRIYTPAGSVTIGGEQTALQALAGPTGWHLIGKTPVAPFRLDREPMLLFEPGDNIRFFSIGEKDLLDMEKASAAGEFVAELVV